ncbi:diacylglycerol kinase family protein [Lewinella sp. 4G2]|uniref:diacylglycerol/lipid kinase family protein n=1 Tax=Lewinella sp. 4G2 TaxID=1803372 RepID=UPI0007B481D7|nr:diacylglycerol kinase family protein [Lewinella sp. 4G2]OAV44369.1 hypothetical protein A3850_007615 [Lewinella sp. 4G2]
MGKATPITTNSLNSSTFGAVQTDSQAWHFIVNPAAGGGKARQRWRTLLPKLQTAFPRMTFAVSTPATSLGALAQDAVREGKHHLIGVGGDGTHHQILNGLMVTGMISKVVYAPLALGSGNDWARSLATPRKLDHWLDHFESGSIQSQMIGHLTFPETGAEHYFLNVAGFAYDAEVVRIAAEERVRHQWMYPILALSYLSEYRPPTVCVSPKPGTRGSAQDIWEGDVHTINVGVGRYSGGGMQFVPHADPFGHQLALTVAQKLPRWKVMANSWRFYAGSIGQVKGVRTSHLNSVHLQPTAGTLECEADGEWLGSGPVTVSVARDRLRVLTAI